MWPWRFFTREIERFTPPVSQSEKLVVTTTRARSAQHMLDVRDCEVPLQHFWSKPSSLRARRPVVAVIDDDDAFRRSALRCVRRVDMNGVGLLDTAAAMRWLVATKPAVVVLPRERVCDAVRACATLSADERPRIIATSNDDTRIDAADAVLIKPLVEAELVELLNQAMKACERKKRVLLVDDDDDIREMYSILLEEEGYEVVPAPHGKAAWNALQAGLRPDVILLDLMMPVMTGQEMFARLQDSPLSSTPVVVITAGGDASPGAAPILRKPIDMRDLLAAVSRAAV